MNAFMYYVYINPLMVHFVFDILTSSGWGDERLYPTALEFVTRLDDIASGDIMNELLKDTVWDTITQTWITYDNIKRTRTFSTYLLENIQDPHQIQDPDSDVTFDSQGAHRKVREGDIFFK